MNTSLPMQELGQSIRFMTSGSRGWAKYYAKSGAAFLRIQNVGKNQMLLDDIAYVDAPNTTEAKRTAVEPGDVLLSVTADLGRAAVVPEGIGPAHINQHLVLIRVEDNICPRFLAAFLSSPIAMMQFQALNREGVKAALNFDDVKSLMIPLPPLPEQKRIADILDKADSIRRKRQQAIGLTEQFLRSTFLDMFGDPVANPKGWQIGTIRDLVTEVKYGTSKKADVEHGEFPILRMNNITYEGSWDFSSLKYVDLDKAEQDKYLVRKGDLLFNRTNSKELVGKTGVYDGPEPMAYAGYLIRARTNKRANPEYISGHLNSYYGKADLKNMCKSIVGMANINAQEFQDMRIMIPDISVQNRYADIVHATRDRMGKYKRETGETNGLFNSLVQRAFKGEL